MFVMIQVFPHFTHGCINPWISQTHSFEQLPISQGNINRVFVSHVSWETSTSCKTFQELPCEAFRIAPEKSVWHVWQLGGWAEWENVIGLDTKT